MWQFGWFFGLTVWHNRKSSFNAIFKSLKITYISWKTHMVSLGKWSTSIVSFPHRRANVYSVSE
jgi:hypothetical protein